MEMLSNTDAVLRLQDITKRLRSNDSSLAHFEPLPQAFSKHQQTDQSENTPNNIGLKADRMLSPSEILSNRQCLSHMTALSMFTIQLTSFSLFENDEFQQAFRLCLEALSRTEDDDVHDGRVIDNRLFEAQNLYRIFGNDIGTIHTSNINDKQERIVVDPTKAEPIIEKDESASILLDEKALDFSSETTGGHKDCVEAKQQQTADILSVKVKHRKNSNIKKVTLRALPEPDLRLALDAVSSLCNLQDLQIINSPQSQCLSVQTLTRVLVALHRSKHRGHGVALPYSATPKLLRTTRKLPTRENAINTNGGLRRLNITTRIQVKSQVQLEELALGLRLHSSTLEYISLHILPRCSSIESPNMNLNSVLKALSSSPGGRSNMLRTCRIVLGYDHNPFGKPLIKPSTLHQVLTSCTRLRRLQLDNFGLTDEHIRVVTNVIQSYQCCTSTFNQNSKFKLQLQELQLARNQHYHYHTGLDRLRLPSNGVTNDLSSRVFTAQSLNELCQAVFRSNFTLRKLCILTSDEMFRLDETMFNATSENSSIGKSEYLVHAQRALNLYTRMNQLGRFRLYNTDSEQVQPWLEALSAAANELPLLNDVISGGETSSFDYDENQSDMLNYQNTQRNSKDDGDREILSVIYSLLRSNPAVLLPGLVYLKQREAPFSKERRIECSINLEPSELVSTRESSLKESTCSSDDRLLRFIPPPPHCVRSVSTGPLYVESLSCGATTIRNRTHCKSSCITSQIDVNDIAIRPGGIVECKSPSTPLTRPCQQQQHVNGWLRTLGNGLNRKAADIIKRLDIRGTESEKQINRPHTEKLREENCDAFCDTTEEEDDTISDHEAILFGVSSSIEFDDEDSLSRYKSNDSKTKSRRRGTRKRSSFVKDRITKSKSSTGQSYQQRIEGSLKDEHVAAVRGVPSRIPPPLLTSSRNEVHPIRFVFEHHSSHRQDNLPSPRRGIPKWSSY